MERMRQKRKWKKGAHPATTQAQQLIRYAALPLLCVCAQ